ncbi:hypothetical protein HPB49_003119 [Dermacentor silvarum]|uniref:Uncharacterized protein n=1 Tax=Dermacentor silvarum TaxID=543639 RepID=A0ACB8DTI8_DERSI|nr:hypothetical protein HPB49_003119 [Dermacentor silvarum]
MGTASRVLKAYREAGRIEDAPRGRPERATSPEEDLLIVAASAADPFLNAKEIRGELGLTRVSLATIRRRLHGAGIHSRVACQKTLLEESHRRARLEFAPTCESGNPDNWRAAVFTDEASFCTRWDVHRRVWRPERTTSPNPILVASCCVAWFMRRRRQVSRGQATFIATCSSVRGWSR